MNKTYEITWRTLNGTCSGVVQKVTDGVCQIGLANGKQVLVSKTQIISWREIR